MQVPEVPERVLVLMLLPSASDLCADIRWWRSIFLNQQSNAATNKAPLISTKCQKTRNRGIRRILPKPRKPGIGRFPGKGTNRGLSRILGSQTPEFASPGRG